LSALEPAPDDLLGAPDGLEAAADGVDVGCVEERDAADGGPIEDVSRARFVALQPEGHERITPPGPMSLGHNTTGGGFSQVA
jgi:hypothetical protein